MSATAATGADGLPELQLLQGTDLWVFDDVVMTAHGNVSAQMGGRNYGCPD